MRCLSDINKTNQPSEKMGLALPLIGLGGFGVAAYFVYQAWDKKRATEIIEKANANSLKHELNLKKTNAKIAQIENRAFVTGKNSRGKVVTINISDAAKTLINQFYNRLTDQYGLEKFIKKNPKDISSKIVTETILTTPLNNIAKLYKIYNIYTGQNFKTDVFKLDSVAQSMIKTVDQAAYKYYPKTFEK